MDKECLKHCLTEDERATFERDGFLVIKDALPASTIKDFSKIVDRLGPGDNIFAKDELFLELIDWPRTFPKVFGVLGWNIHSYYTQIVVSPPQDKQAQSTKRRRGWHQEQRSD